MLSTFVIWLLLSLDWVVGVNVRQSNLDIWDIDASCAPYRPVLQKAYDDAAVMAAKALTDIKFVKGPRPRDSRSKRGTEWDRIARAVENMFGFMPDEKGTDMGDKYFNRVLSVYDTMNKALQGDYNLPVGGYTGLYSKALWICGEKPWKWYRKDEKDPNNPSQPLYQSKPDLLKGSNGVWIYERRYIANGDPRSVNICGPSTQANTMIPYDIITFCEPCFGSPISEAESPVDGRDGVVAGNKRLDDFGQFSLSRIMIHELVHWYGAESVKETDRLIDQQAVSSKGELMWFYSDGGQLKTASTSKKMPGISYQPLKTYYYAWVTRLARSHEGELAVNSGPQKATETAEAYAYFAMMAYLDNFDWSKDGKAKVIE